MHELITLLSSVHSFVRVGLENITMGRPNLVHIQAKSRSPCIGSGRPMVIYIYIYILKTHMNERTLLNNFMVLT